MSRPNSVWLLPHAEASRRFLRVARDRAGHTLELATELLDDIELQRIPLQAALLKAGRLARLVGDDEAQRWIAMELYGYQDDEVGRRHMDFTARWIDKPTNKGYWAGAAQLEVQLDALKARLQTLRLPDVSGEWASVALRETRSDQAGVTGAMTTLGVIISKVWALLHRFVSTRYYELAFSEEQGELFQHARSRVDALLSPLSGEVLAKVESIYRRLGEDDSEAVSQALNTCRRLIDAVADAVFPPTDGTTELAGNVVSLGPSHTQNRLNAFVRNHTASESRRKKLRRTLGDLYDRVSTGVHSDVTPDEARFLFLNTYLCLGEVLALGTTEGT